MIDRISASFTNSAQLGLNEIPSGLSKKGDLGTARDREWPYYGPIHIRLKIPLVNASHFCRDSFLGIDLIASKKAASCSAAKFGAGYAFQSLAGKSFTRCRTLIACSAFASRGTRSTGVTFAARKGSSYE